MKKIKNVLLIDDNEITNYLHAFLFQDLGIAENIHAKLNGQEAIDFLSTCNEEEQPDLILLDINMPIMDGFEFLSHYQNTKMPDITVLLMVSTSINPYDVERSQQFSQVNGFVGKPLTEEKIQNIRDEHFNT